MKTSFQKLDVWNNAFGLAKNLGAIFYQQDFKNYGFQDQIMRATISISNNIAEGNNRGSAKDFVKFLFIAKGSCGEVQNMCLLAQVYGYLNDQQTNEFVDKTEIIMQQLGKLISYLKSKYNISKSI